jgi:anion-transporting  ArsA/GET3 family ATPase
MMTAHGGSSHNPDGWTFATLYKHVMALSDASKDAVSAAMSAAKLATDKADAANEKRFDAVNEFRATLKDQNATFADKSQTDFRLGAIEKQLATVAGKSQGIWLVALIITQTLLILIALGTFIMQSRHG